jgi:hypothetical protein
MRPLILLAACLALPTNAFAAMIVWEAFGEITRASTTTPIPPGFIPPPGSPPLPPQAPPIGTPYAIQLSFDPGLAVPTPIGIPAPGSSACSMTTYTGTFDLGGVDYSLSGRVFTNGSLPNNNCLPGTGSIDFFGGATPLAVDIWELGNSQHFMDLRYYDAIHQDGTFPSTPTPLTDDAHRDSLLFETFNFQFEGRFQPHQVLEQTAPVPEPATMTMVGIGLAFAARRRRRATQSRSRPDR